MRHEACKFCRKEVVWWAILVNIAQMSYKGLLGLMTGSAALIADSMHSGADVIASLVTMTSVKISSRQRSDDYPYGYGNIQYISSSIVGLILVIALLTLPAAVAGRLTRRLGAMMLVSVVLCLVLTTVPRAAVYGTRISPESAIVLAAGGLYLLALLLRRPARRSRGSSV